MLSQIRLCTLFARCVKQNGNQLAPTDILVKGCFKKLLKCLFKWVYKGLSFLCKHCTELERCVWCLVMQYTQAWGSKSKHTKAEVWINVASSKLEFGA